MAMWLKCQQIVWQHHTGPPSSPDCECNQWKYNTRAWSRGTYSSTL